MIVTLVSGLVVTSEVRDLVRHGRNQRTSVHVNVRSVGVVRVGMCMLCVSDIEQCERGVGSSVSG